MQEQQGCILESGVEPALEEVDTSIGHSALPMDLPCMQQQQRTSSIRLILKGVIASIVSSVLIKSFIKISQKQ